jgi:hypothetical protein
MGCDAAVVDAHAVIAIANITIKIELMNFFMAILQFR